MIDSNYANPDALVTTEWVASHMNEPNTRLVESNEDILLYSTGHIP
jgi:thiosulfate/3-mercaptopyruvate sulfurtransferase